MTLNQPLPNENFLRTPLTVDVQFSTDKKLATTQDRQTLQNSDEKQYSQ